MSARAAARAALRGKIAATFEALVRDPGRLTLEQLGGRGARYMPPAVLFLLCSAVYFALSAIGGWAQPSANQRATGLTADAQRQLLDAAFAPAVLKPMLRRLATDPAAYQRELVETVPAVMFVMLPVFSAIVALFYRGRRYAEHVTFALDVHALLFLALAAAALIALMRIEMVAIIADVASALWVLVYWHDAIRRVYGGSRRATIAKELGIGALYAAVTVPVSAAIALWLGGR
ncbi:MAG TPA: DUF3667 domain-containing protein [Gemmatimonadaceae bacterium]|jgi:hypothetical protein|nr:DUF3667 domain-containing protein [Gemmatimonadaceae bacterium]